MVWAVSVRVVDGAVMPGAPSGRHRVPSLLAGAAAPDGAEKLAPLGFRAELVGSELGQDPPIKLCRSRLVKAPEAPLCECIAIARPCGATDIALSGVGDALDGKRRLKESRGVPDEPHRCSRDRLGGCSTLGITAADARLHTVRKARDRELFRPHPGSVGRVRILLREVPRL